jgi:hypothetical protein
MYLRDLQVISGGSRIFPYAVPIQVHAVTNWYDLRAMFGNEMLFWDYLDSVTIQNNSTLPIWFYLNSTDNGYYILSYGTQPITRRPFRTFGFYNPDGAVDIAAGLITMNMRRLPSGVMGVVKQS